MKITAADLDVEKTGEPFEIELANGKTYSLLHPADVHGTALLNFEAMAPAEALRFILDSDYDEFMAQREVTVRFLSALLQKYTAHFGLGPVGNAAASPQS